MLAVWMATGVLLMHVRGIAALAETLQRDEVMFRSMLN